MTNDRAISQALDIVNNFTKLFVVEFVTAPIERADDGRRKFFLEDRKVCKRHHFIVPTVIKNDPRYPEEVKKVFSESEIVALPLMVCSPAWRRNNEQPRN